MEFIKESEGFYVGVSHGNIINGYGCQEWLWCELEKDESGGWLVRFEDSWSKAHVCSSLEEAQEYVLGSYHKHTPHANDVKYEVD